ncbi:MAG: diguanylate cyclase [Nitrospinota bacterium]
MKEITVKTFMTKKVFNVSVDTPLQKIVAIIQKKKLSCLVITDNECPVGIISERDLIRVFHRALEDRPYKTLTARNIMSVPPITCCKDTSFYDALVILQTQRIRHLPVVDPEDKLAGILTYSDLAQKYVHILNQEKEKSHKSQKQLEEDNSKLTAMSFEDPLMEIGNRRAMEVDLHYTHSLALRYKAPYSILVIDIDWFKKFNDCYGHSAGDQALKKTAKTLRQAIRGSDRIYRYGGEEILILLPQTGPEGSFILAEKLVGKVSQRKIPHKESPFQVLTVSCGVASFAPEKESPGSWKELFKVADQELYLAKKNGRSRVGYGAAL